MLQFCGESTWSRSDSGIQGDVGAPHVASRGRDELSIWARISVFGPPGFRGVGEHHELELRSPDRALRAGSVRCRRQMSSSRKRRINMLAKGFREIAEIER